MVKFIPPFMGQEIKSNAEKKMFDTLQTLNFKDTYVLHSLGLPKHKDQIYGEVDFVVVCRRGIACLEIKGGRVECMEGIWKFTNRYGIVNEKPKGPYAQVTDNMFSLSKALKQKFEKDQRIKSVLVACGVVFPDIEFKSRGEEIIPEITFDKTTTDITDYINGVFDYWEKRASWKTSELTMKDVEDVVKYLRGDFAFIPSLNDRLEDTDSRLLRLTSEQARIMDALSNNDHLMISGGAGTGKTVLAFDFANKKAANGERVLYLTYNKNLANDLTEGVSEGDMLKIINIHAMFTECIDLDLEQMNQDAKLYFDETLPGQYYDYLSSLPMDVLDDMKYDFLVMDEGQDIMKPNFLYSLDLLLRGGLEKGHWAVFYDENQNIYNDEYAEGLELLKSYHSTEFKLFINCRNTIQIGNYIEKITGITPEAYLKESGEEVVKVSYRDDDDFRVKINEILKKLKAEKLRLKEVTILAPRKYEKSILRRAGIDVEVIGQDMEETSDKPRFSTVQGFKGLDSKVVIFCDLDGIYEPQYERLAYIAASRARTLLYVVGSEEFWEKH